MGRPPPLPLPLRDGVAASRVALRRHLGDGVLDFLATRLPQVSREDWAQRLADGEVRDPQGQPVPLNARVTDWPEGAPLHYWRSVPEEPELHGAVRVLHLDPQLLVADKPTGLPMTPTGRTVRESMQARLRVALGLPHLSPVHRLDRDTAGLTLWAVTPVARDAYQRLFRERRVCKIYHAVAPLHPFFADAPKGVLWRHSRLQERDDAFMQMHEVPGPPNAHTAVRLIERRGHQALYALQPETGRKHQLRAHMAALGCPIVGDRIYPQWQPEAATPDRAAPLQLLASELAWTDPFSGLARRFVSPRAL